MVPDRNKQGGMDMPDGISQETITALKRYRDVNGLSTLDDAIRSALPKWAFADDPSPSIHTSITGSSLFSTSLPDLVEQLQPMNSPMNDLIVGKSRPSSYQRKLSTLKPTMLMIKEMANECEYNGSVFTAYDIGPVEKYADIESDKGEPRFFERVSEETSEQLMEIDFDDPWTVASLLQLEDDFQEDRFVAILPKGRPVSSVTDSSEMTLIHVVQSEPEPVTRGSIFNRQCELS